ncbi:MAG: hypothetical protein ABEI96_11795 [Haloarculaceae archaeon]
MKLPEGRLRRSRAVTDPGTALSNALDRRLTGYAILEPQDALLLDGDGVGVVTFENGVPVLAYHTGTDRGGPEALADLAASGPYWLELYAVDPAALESLHETPALCVPPAMPADRLGDTDLAERTRRHAPDDRIADAAAADSLAPVEAFLDDEAKIEHIRERAREEAAARAEEWGFTDAVDD